MRVCFSGSRWLGIKALQHLAQQNVEIVGVHVPERGFGWWDDIDEQAEVRALHLPVMDANDFRLAHPDLVFSVLSYHIFKWFPPAGGVNLHPAPLPEYRGCNSYAHAILNGDITYAATLHYMVAAVDEGPIIAQEWIPVGANETGISLYWRAQVAALELWKRELPRILRAARYGNRRVASTPQDETRARYYPRSSLNDKTLTGLSPENQERKRRALIFPPFPPAEEPLNPIAVIQALSQIRTCDLCCPSCRALAIDLLEGQASLSVAACRECGAPTLHGTRCPCTDPTVNPASQHLHALSR